VSDKNIFIGAESGGKNPQYLELTRTNRHGLISGATGTGKTVTLQGIVEGLSAVGVPTFLADVKGDLAGLAMAGSPTAKTHEIFAGRAKDIGLGDWTYHDTPVQFWDLFGEQGHPIRTTVSEMGPLLLARLMNLNEVQEGVLNIAFTVADKEQLLLLDLDDLQSMLVHCGEEADQLTLQYGNVSKQSVGSIQRSLLQLRSQGGDHFFGEPAVDLHDFLAADDQGRGIVNILAADKLMASPRLYATFLLWMLSELFQVLPEVGDPEKPVMCFFFDEAHLLFDDAAPALLEKVEQVVRLIRSKGVGVYFISQNPIDVPDKVAAQLNNRIQHKLNAFTPRDQQAVKAAADTFRPNRAIDVASAITELKIGEALISLLQADGSPEPVQRILVKPPSTRVGPLTSEERKVIVATDAVGAKYDTLVDRQSAQELLNAKAAEASAAAASVKAQSDGDKQAAEQAKLEAQQAKEQARAQIQQQRLDLQRQRMEQQDAARHAREAARPSLTDKVLQSAVRAASSSVGRQLGNQLLRGVLGGLMRR
jgi:DNA helicase HerA-like ATPase